MQVPIPWQTLTYILATAGRVRHWQWHLPLASAQIRGRTHEQFFIYRSVILVMASTTREDWLTSTPRTLSMSHLHIGQVLCSRSQGSIQFLWKRWLVEDDNQQVSLLMWNITYVAATRLIYKHWKFIHSRMNCLILPEVTVESYS